MNTLAASRLLIPIALPLLVLGAWVWVAARRVDRDLETFDGFEGMHFDR